MSGLVCVEGKPSVMTSNRWLRINVNSALIIYTAIMLAAAIVPLWV